MQYLRLRRTQWILASFLLAAVLLSEFSWLDLRVSAAFYDGRFAMQGAWWERVLDASVHYMLYLSVAGAVGLYVCNKLLNRRWLDVDGRKLAYLILALTVGAGLVVNMTLKEGVGRARPKEIVEFAGTKHFTPAFAMAHECKHNCSFSSGHAAGACFSFALAFAFSSRRRRLALWVAAAYGALVSLSRIASGAHFLSDCVVSFFVMLITSDALYYYMLARTAALKSAPEFEFLPRDAALARRLALDRLGADR